MAAPFFTTLLLALLIKEHAILTNQCPKLHIFRDLLSLRDAEKETVGEWFRNAANSCPRTQADGYEQLNNQTIPLLSSWSRHITQTLIDSALYKCVEFIRSLPSSDINAKVKLCHCPTEIEPCLTCCGHPPLKTRIEPSFTSLIILVAIKGELVVNQLDYENVDVCAVYLDYNDAELGVWFEKASDVSDSIRTREEGLRAYYKSIKQYGQITKHLQLNKRVTDAVEQNCKEFVDKIPSTIEKTCKA